MPQLLQLTAAVVDQRPVAHAVQELAPLSLALPASQSLQTKYPASAAMVPAAQTLHEEAPAAAAMVPAEQAVQIDSPALAEYFPASQSLQSPTAS